MKALKINPFDKTVSEIDVEDPEETFKDLYKEINCDTVEFVRLFKDVIAACDENGKLIGIDKGFTFNGFNDTIVGIGVVFSGNMNTIKDCVLDKKLVEDSIIWV